VTRRICGAAAFLRAHGPVPVPLRLCCALALVQAPAAVVCEADPTGALLWPDPDADLPAVEEPVR
jgi:hypothetical protein